MTSQAGAIGNHRIQNEVLACMVIVTRTVQACTRKAARSRWWLLLIIGAGTLLTVVALKLVALFGAAVHVSFLRDVGQNVDLPGAFGGGGAGLAASLGQPGLNDPVPPSYPSPPGKWGAPRYGPPMPAPPPTAWEKFFGRHEVLFASVPDAPIVCMSRRGEKEAGRSEESLPGRHPGDG